MSLPNSWTFSGSADWNNSLYWSALVVPGPGDDVTITQGNPQITNEDVGTVNSVSVSGGSSLFILDGSLGTSGDLEISGSYFQVDDAGNPDPGGSVVTIGGTLINSSGIVYVGGGNIANATTVSAAGLSNSGQINIYGGISAQATLDIEAAAGFGTTGVLDGTVNMLNRSLLKFTSGQITSIAADGHLTLNGPGAHISSDGTLDNSALDLSSNAGSLYVYDNTLTSTGNLTNLFGGTIGIDSSGPGGSDLAITGKLINNWVLPVGNAYNTAATTVTAAGLDNRGGTIQLSGGAWDAATSSYVQATMNIAAPAGFGVTGQLDGSVNLSSGALLEFSGGPITTIAADGSLIFNGPDAYISSDGTLTNSALTGLTINAGNLYLHDTVLATSGDLTNTGDIQVDAGNPDSGGSVVTIGGTLINSGIVYVGGGNIANPTTVNAAGLSNSGQGDIYIYGGTSAQSTLDIGAAAASVLDGTVTLSNQSLLEFSSGQITSIAADGHLTLNGPDAHVSSDGTLDNSALDLSSNAGSLSISDNALTSTGDLTNSGSINIDTSGYGGSDLAIDGTLTNSGSGSAIYIGNGGLSSPTSVTAAGVVNQGQFTLIGGASVSTIAGFDNSGTLDVDWSSSTSGSSLDVGGTLSNEPTSHIYVGSSSSYTSTTLTADALNNAGNIDVESSRSASGPASINVSSDLDNSGSLYIDHSSGNAGSTLDVSGVLTNEPAGIIDVGNNPVIGLASSIEPLARYVETSVNVGGLDNTGTINLENSSTLTISNKGETASNDSGNLTVGNGADLVLAGAAQLTVSDLFGGIETHNYHTIAGAGTVTIDTSATLLLQGHGESTLGAANGPGVTVSNIINNGTIDGEGGYALIGTTGGDVSGTGTLFDGAGTLLEIASAVDSGSTLKFDMGVSTQETAQIDDLAGVSSGAGTQQQDYNAQISDFIAGDTLRVEGLGTFSTIDGESTQYDSSTGITSLLLTDGGQTVATLEFTGDYNNLFTVAADQSISGAFDVSTSAVACYCRSTLILTECGEVPVERLAIGDMVVTASGATRPIKWIGRRSYGGRFLLGQEHILPICIKAGALDANTPRRDLWISPHHAMYLEGVLIEAHDLVNGVNIVQPADTNTVEYFHIELETHDVIIAEGSLSETFIDDNSRGMFHNAHEYPLLYAEERQAPVRYYAPRCDSGYEVEAARRQIEECAGLCPLTEAERPSKLRGHIDLVTSGIVAGWAQSMEHPEAPVCLDVYVGDQVVGQTLANRYREDLQNAGIGSGCHSFTFEPPPGLDISSGVVEIRRSIDGATVACSEARPKKDAKHTTQGRVNRAA
jgi:hypothetical protein